MDKDKIEHLFHDLVNLMRSGTPSQIGAYLDHQRTTIQKFRNQIHQSSSQEHRHKVYVNILTYVDRQIYMLGRFIGEPIECIAWIARNLYEVNLLTQYLGSDEQKAKMFVSGQFAFDELQILRGFNGLNLTNPDPTLEDSRKYIDLRIKQINESLDRSNIKEKGPIPTGTLADLTGDRNSYDAYFHFYSKYVHPSPWIINATQEQVDTKEHRTMFLVEAVLNAAEIESQVADIFQLD